MQAVYAELISEPSPRLKVVITFAHSIVGQYDLRNTFTSRKSLPDGNSFGPGE